MKRPLLTLLLALSATAAGTALAQDSVRRPVSRPAVVSARPPVELTLTRAESKTFDLRTLPYVAPVPMERNELEEPDIDRTEITPTGPPPIIDSGRPGITRNAPAPPPIAVYEGLDRFNWGAGSPPDTNGDVGPNYYIQTVNTSIGVYRKSDGFREAAFTFNTFMSQGSFGNLCDTNNFGDPVVLYDSFEDRWMISDFAFVVDGGGNVVAPSYQCIAVSKTGDPIAGGWNFYSRQITDALNDYPKFGIWPDGIYMSSNMFTFGAGATFTTARVWAFNKAQMYAGSPTVNVVSFDVPGGDFTVIPSNARLQTGTPPAGTPNYFLSTWQFLNALTVYKLHVDWSHLSLSTFTGPDAPVAATSWPNAAVANAAQPGTATLLDVLQIRAMVQNQYTNFGGTESLWVPHTVRRGDTTGFAAPRWYQANVTGGTVAANLVQATTWDPDAANVINRFMPTLALDRAGNMAMGYNTSGASAPAFPSMKYAGRLAADPVNTFSQTEQTFVTGTASQTGTSRWGDYNAMTLDPDGCTFWFTSEYANPADQTFNHRWLTKFGSIGAFPGCTPAVAGGTLSGTVTATSGGAPISGATVALGSRTTTTAANGTYTFSNLASGTYPGESASGAGYNASSIANVVVADSATTTQNFSLTLAPTSGCLTDTTQADFQIGVPTNCDLTSSPGDVTLLNAPAIDQQNTAGTTTGTGFGTPAWTGQPSVGTAQIVGQLSCFGFLALSVLSTASGQEFATQPIKFIVDSAPGSATDVINRIVSERLSQIWGQQVLTVNTPGAGGSIAARVASRAEPDGATFYVGNAAVFTARAGAAASLPVEIPRDFTPVGFIALQPMFIAVAPSLSIPSLPGLIELAKKRPGELSYATTGRGRVTHLTMELLQERAGIKLQMIPYTGGPHAAMADLATGRVAIVIEAYSGIAPGLQGGTIKAVAVTSLERLVEFSDIPTVSETLPGFVAGGWNVLLAPVGISDSKIGRVAADLRKVLEEPAIKHKLAAFGAYPRAMNPAEVLAFVGEQQRTWRPIAERVASEMLQPR